MKRKYIILSSLVLLFIFSFSIAFISINDDKNEAFGKDNTIIAAYINGKKSSGFPATADYSALVSCFKGNDVATGTFTVSWDSTSSKWLLNMSGVTQSDVQCNIYFSNDGNSLSIPE